MDDISISKTQFTQSQLKSILQPLSHDLKNYLTNVYLHAQMLDKKVTNESEKKHIAKMLSGIKQFDEHLTALGEIVKTYYGNIEIRKEKVTLDVLVTQLERSILSVHIENHCSDPKVSLKAVDTVKLIRMLKLIISRYAIKTVSLTLSETNDEILITCQGEASPTPPFEIGVLRTYIDIVSRQMDVHYKETTKTSLLSLKKEQEFNS